MLSLILNAARWQLPTPILRILRRRSHTGPAPRRSCGAHPEIRALIGPSQATFWWTLVVVALQGVVAWFAATSRGGWSFLLAYTVGAFANHAPLRADSRVHPSPRVQAEDAELRHRPARQPAAVHPVGAVPFQKYHLKHHAFQGVYELDADVPSLWEAQVDRATRRSARRCGSCSIPFFQMLRPIRMKEVAGASTAGPMINLAIQIGVNVAVYYWPRAQGARLPRLVVLLLDRASSAGRPLDPAPLPQRRRASRRPSATTAASTQ